jgi:hypothetical protein
MANKWMICTNEPNDAAIDHGGEEVSKRATIVTPGLSDTVATEEKWPSLVRI